MTTETPTHEDLVDDDVEKTSALVIGGGVAGMQAALDIAAQGFHVYLVEKSPSVGGRMAMIDKTFPTLDCSACILTPRLSEVARHPNIELLTYSEVKRVTGKVGNFTAEIHRNARYVNEEKCSGCGDCVPVCPIEVPNEFDQDIGFRKAIYVPFPQATPNVYTIDKRDHAACRMACPAGVNAQAFVTLLNQEKYRDALRIVRDAIPFPGVLGRVCISFCESECARGEYDESVSIRNLHRFLHDYEREQGEVDLVVANIDKEEKVAVVGAGPAGISVAYHLARKGYPVTVFEKRDTPGGLLKYSIPEYRLPRDILKEEIDRVAEYGVEFVMNTNIASVDELRKKGFKAIFIGTGASKSNRLMVDGEDADGVFHAIDFLDRVNTGEQVKIGDKVAIIGGGDAAVDSCRTALRLGAAEVTLVYRRSHVEIPAIPSEVEDARQEGVRFMFLTQPTKVITTKGAISGLRCIRMKLGEPDYSGRRRPIPVPESDLTLAVDTIIVAIGQSVETIPIHKGFDVTSWGTLVTDPITLQTSQKDVFAGGDVVLGPATAVKACGQGQEAAISIDRYLRKIDLSHGREEKDFTIAKPVIDQAHFHGAKRAEMPKEGISSRKASFQEVEIGFDEEDAVDEAGRCLNCTICCECGQCVIACERGAIDHDDTDKTIILNVGAIVVATGFKLFDVSEYTRLGYSKFPNVINAMEFERLINAAGPTQGHLIRFSDGKVPKKIGFIQCVGARDTQKGVPNCSRVCCMYGIKNAVMVKEHDPEAEVTMYYADIRAFGKGFEEFYEMARTRFGVKFVRGRVAEVDEDAETKNLIIQVEDTETGQLTTKNHDLMIISPGLQPPEDLDKIAEELGIDLGDEGYIKVRDPLVAPVDTGKTGIFVAGCADGPKDIPDSVTAGSAAAMRATILLNEADKEKQAE
ncbi:MAG: FAD-dependent oxidoreductase [Candidatus Thorarchaeota archaeon]